MFILNIGQPPFSILTGKSQSCPERNERILTTSTDINSGFEIKEPEVDSLRKPKAYIVDANPSAD
jgi:hypothetical protein